MRKLYNSEIIELLVELTVVIEKLIVNYLKSYLDTLESFHSAATGNIIEIQGRTSKESNSCFILLRMVVNIENREFFIYNIFIPYKDRKRGVGFGLLSFIYKITTTVDFALILGELTDSFRKKMLDRGAKETTKFDYLKITDKTDLT